jgi:hypothetical protein
MTKPQLEHSGVSAVRSGNDDIALTARNGAYLPEVHSSHGPLCAVREQADPAGPGPSCGWSRQSRVIVALGGIAWQALWPVLATAGCAVARLRPAFAHGAGSPARSPDRTSVAVRGCYHSSQQNTFTGPRHARRARRDLHPGQGHVRWRVTVAAEYRISLLTFADSSVSSRGSRLPP